MYTLKTEAHFDSAHFLTNYFGKCENLHGHRWRVVVCIERGTLVGSGSERDMVMDFNSYKAMVNKIADSLDHTFLVEEGSLAPATIEALEGEGFTLKILPFRTTAENLAKWFFDQMASYGMPVSQVEMYETPLNCAIYRP
jgi:6-pyruvoyltetrahydropterin/6-carboxytetrahydropterin synthase